MNAARSWIWAVVSTLRRRHPVAAVGDLRDDLRVGLRTCRDRGRRPSRRCRRGHRGRSRTLGDEEPAVLRSRRFVGVAARPRVNATRAARRATTARVSRPTAPVPRRIQQLLTPVLRSLRVRSQDLTHCDAGHTRTLRRAACITCGARHVRAPRSLLTRPRASCRPAARPHLFRCHGLQGSGCPGPSSRTVPRRRRTRQPLPCKSPGRR